MGLKYLWDTNTVIYYLQKNFSSSGERLIDDVVNNFQPAISIITEIELLCWKMATESDIALIQRFIANSVVYELDERVKLKTIEIRKQSSLKLPDAIIAATAIANRFTLISRNEVDFKKVEKIDLLNPYVKF